MPSRFVRPRNGPPEAVRTILADDALLVGKKKALARASGRKGGRNARGADHGLHDDVRVGIIREAGDGLGAAEHLDVAEADRAEGLFQLHHLRGIPREPPATA